MAAAQIAQDTTETAPDVSLATGVGAAGVNHVRTTEFVQIGPGDEIDAKLASGSGFRCFVAGTGVLLGRVLDRMRMVAGLDAPAAAAESRSSWGTIPE